MIAAIIINYIIILIIMRMFYKVLDTVMINKMSYLGLGLCYYMGRRFTNNIHELEQNTQEKKLFDPMKAKA